MLTNERLAEIRRRAEEATPPPWYVVFLDDDHAMNMTAVATVPDDGTHARWPEFDHEAIVAATLVQQPRYVDIEDGRWDENAAFIAHARTDIPDLLVALDAAKAEVTRLTVEQDALAGRVAVLTEAGERMAESIARIGLRACSADCDHSLCVPARAAAAWRALLAGGVAPGSPEREWRFGDHAVVTRRTADGYRADCSCGWEYENTSPALVLRALQKHSEVAGAPPTGDGDWCRGCGADRPCESVEACERGAAERSLR